MALINSPVGNVGRFPVHAPDSTAFGDEQDSPFTRERIEMRHSSRDSQIAAFRLARHHLTDSSRSATARLAFSPIAKRGTVVVPARLRRKFGIEEGQLVIAEERPDGILIRPALALPFEIYTPGA